MRILTLSAALIAATLSSPLMASDWTAIIQTPEEKVSIDISSIVLRDNGLIEARTLTVRAEDGIHFQRTREFDCTMYSWRTLIVSTREGSVGDFRPLRIKPAWGDDGTGSEADVELLLWVCDYDVSTPKPTPAKRSGFLFGQ